jgi:hypothetical protein
LPVRSLRELRVEHELAAEHGDHRHMGRPIAQE